MTVLLGLLVAIFVVLALPVELRFDARWPDTQCNRFELRWAFGAVRFDLAAGDDEAARGERRARRSQPRKRTFSITRALKVPQFRWRMKRFLGDLWRAVHKESIRIDCHVGLETPADTGMLWSIMGPVAGTLQTARGCRILLQPEFACETVDIHGQGTVRTYPIQLLGLLIGLLLSPSLWRGIRASRSRA